MALKVGFDLFNTLIVARPNALEAAMENLLWALNSSGMGLNRDLFFEAYKGAAIKSLKEARITGRETHNRLWIADALRSLGLFIEPCDPAISRAVDAYFQIFFEYSQPIPGVYQVLEELSRHYELGLLSNFTHHPACKAIIDHLGLRPYFRSIIISGEIGFVKPHPTVFDALCYHLRAHRTKLVYVGDDPEADVEGALNAGLKALWFSYVFENKHPFAKGYTYTPPDPERVKAPKATSWEEVKDYLRSLEDGREQ